VCRTGARAEQSRNGLADVPRIEMSDPAQRPLTTEQLMTAMGLVDEILHCDAQINSNLDWSRRLQLESAVADRADLLRAFLDSAHRG
jgi:hypothetical protein